MQSAPFFADIAEGPDGGQAVWATARDGIRIRVGWWRAPGPVADGAATSPSAANPVPTEKGTVLIFPGRTEYIEKYGRDAKTLIAAGYAVLAIDWRGQGIADRMLDNPVIGHVGAFSDYQLDVAAALDVAQQAGLPKPWHVIGHSMGGSIALRALYNDLPVETAMFSAPMWGIKMRPFVRPSAWVLGWIAAKLGFAHWIAPGTKPAPYVISKPFKRNKLTTDLDMYEYMQRQLRAHPELNLGGPSIHWVNKALRETLDLSRMAPLNLPGLTFLGTNERIVDKRRIRQRMAQWSGAELIEIEGAEHEVMLETPDRRRDLFDRAIALFDAHPGNDDRSTAVKTA